MTPKTGVRGEGESRPFECTCLSILLVHLRGHNIDFIHVIRDLIAKDRQNLSQLVHCIDRGNFSMLVIPGKAWAYLR